MTVSTYVSMITLAAATLFIGRLEVANAATVASYDFEDTVLPIGENSLVLTSPLVISNNGIQMTISRENNAGFAVNQRTGPLFVERFDNLALSTFAGLGISTDAFIFNFDHLLSNVNLDVGDFGGDEDTILLQAFAGIDATGPLVDTANGFLAGDPSQMFSFENLTLSGPNIQSVRLTGVGLDGGQSLFYDNISVTAVPEPSSFAALAMLAGIFGIGRRRKSGRLPRRISPIG